VLAHFVLMVILRQGTKPLKKSLRFNT